MSFSGHRLISVRMFTQRASSVKSVKNYEEIPGPKPLPVIGNAHMFSPLGPYKIEKLLAGFSDLREKYGNIVRLQLGQDAVLVFDPDDIRTMYKCEGRYPSRPTFEALKKYRQEKFACVGLVPDNGEEWYILRQSVVQMLHMRTVQSYWDRQLKVAQDFAKNLPQNCDSDGELTDFLPHAFMYALEAVGVFCFGRRLNCLSGNNEEGKKIVEANQVFLTALGATFHGFPWWKLYKTEAYRKIELTQNFLNEIATEYLHAARHKMSENEDKFAEEDPLLYSLLTSRHLNETQINVVITELFQGGVDATATTITMMLYHLSRNASIQQSIFMCLKDNPLKPGHIPVLLRACLKETFRLHPTASANSRLLSSDAVMSNYFIPKGTMVIGVNPVISRMDNYFERPQKFDPWRWLSKGKLIHPYSVLPFGHGLRMCPGRRFAEQEIYLCISQIILKYQVISFNNSDIDMVLATNLVPDRPVSFGFLLRG